ncbi:MAG: preprotein translocase subunit SecE [Eggerthellaceae bacterium]|nr:preprotein translocase subunit SecE [Eggerthellaceae bacterium]
MAKKSKTQKAKAALKRKQRKLAADQGLNTNVEETVEVLEVEKEGFKKKITKVFRKSEKKEGATPPEKADSNPTVRNKFIQFLIDVKGELKRVTCPNREDVIRWSGVVVGSLIFFGLYVVFFDNLLITPLLLIVAGFGG